jgi:hypothetical protein
MSAARIRTEAVVMTDDGANNLSDRGAGWHVEGVTPIEPGPEPCQQCGELLKPEAMACPICGEPNGSFAAPPAAGPEPANQKKKSSQHSILYDTGAATAEVADTVLDILNIFGGGI